MILASNWKMSMGLKKAKSFLESFSKKIKAEEKKNFLFFPPSPLSFLFGDQWIFLGSSKCLSQE